MSLPPSLSDELPILLPKADAEDDISVVEEDEREREAVDSSEEAEDGELPGLLLLYFSHDQLVDCISCYFRVSCG